MTIEFSHVGCGACGKAADRVVGDSVVASDRGVRVELVVGGPHRTDGQNDDLAHPVGQRASAMPDLLKPGQTETL